MKRSKLSLRELAMLGVLAVLIIGLCYYLGFYKPLQEDIAELRAESAELDGEISTAMTNLSSIDKMQKELDEILARPKDEVSEIAPYDNKEVVLNELNAILYGTDYSLNFAEPEFQDDGIVRRVVSMSFRCNNYESAKGIITALARNQWRCLVGNLSVSSADNVMTDEVKVTATVTFFESTELGKDKAPETTEK